MSRKKYVCDFETTTKKEDCRVWAYGWMEIGNTKNFKIGNSLRDFMSWCETVKSDCYFHHLKFDGSFIVNYLLSMGYEHNNTGKKGTFNTIISKMGQWYVIDICYGYKGKQKLHTKIYDSLKKLPFKVSKIAKDFNLKVLKGDIDYHEERPPFHIITPKEYTYIKNDIEIVAEALKIQFEQGLDRMTTGSDSLKGFKSVITTKEFERLFPVLSHDMDKEIRDAYRGGFTWLNEKYARKNILEGLIFDVNSLYPSQMYYRPLPYDTPLFFNGEYKDDKKYPLYIQHIKCDFDLKKDHIPTIQIKTNLMFNQNEYLKTSDDETPDLYMTNIDLQLMHEHYDVYNIEYIDGWKFKQKTGIFNTFIDKWTYIKTHFDGAIKLLAKLMLNSLYGKFATNPNITGKIPYLKEDGSLGFSAGEDEMKDPVYTAMGVFITSWARYTTISTAQKCYDRIIYCDTDSIHIEGTEIPEAIKDVIDDKKLGYWQHEATFQRGKYLRQKTYMNELIVKPYVKFDKARGRVIETNKKISVKCAGMSDKIKEKVTFENFKIGFSSYGKLLPKQVKGGVVLVDTEFTIK